MSAHEPVCISLILCDQVIEDRITHNKSYIGTFNEIRVGRLPAMHPRFSVAISVTDGLGQHPLQLQIVGNDEQGNERIDFQVSANLNLKDPLDVTDVVFNVVNFPIRSIGHYLIRATLGKSQAIYQRAFRVLQQRPQQGEGEGNPPPMGFTPPDTPPS